jgi:hypothetical protein
MTQRGPAEEAEFEAKSRTGSKCEGEMSESISFPEHARSQVRGGHSSGEIELIHVGFPT